MVTGVNIPPRARGAVDAAIAEAETVVPVAFREECGNCRFWYGQGGTGVCRMYPPVTVRMSGGGDVFRQPPVAAIAWCGQWQPSAAAEDDLTFQYYRGQRAV